MLLLVSWRVLVFFYLLLVCLFVFWLGVLCLFHYYYHLFAVDKEGNVSIKNGRMHVDMIKFTFLISLNKNYTYQFKCVSVCV